MLEGAVTINVDAAGIEYECSGFHRGNVLEDLFHFIQGQVPWQGNSAGPQFVVKSGCA